MTAKVCSVHLATHLIQSNIVASKLGTTLLKLDVALTQLKDILKVKYIKMHMKASQRRENSYFDREEEKKATMLKNEFYFKVFKALYWLEKEGIASTKLPLC